MKRREIKREYRVLALAIVIFVAGAGFFFYDKARVAEVRRTTNLASSDQGGEQPTLKGPEPSAFKIFSYALGKTLPSVKDTCRDAYISVLIFKANLDYRKDPARASINRAFSCNAGESFKFSLSNADTRGMEFGDYYIIVADQGRVGAWYNPR